MSNQNDEFIFVRHKWEVNITAPLQVYVVQPELHLQDKLFESILDSFFNSENRLNIAPFDLIVFPEAFLPMDSLIHNLKNITELASRMSFEIGCVHTGLRPDSTSENHLFSREKVEELLKEIKSINICEKKDLICFENWFLSNVSSDPVNLAIFFTKDRYGKIRICLHPKIVRSKYEESMYQEQNMQEGRLLSLVSLSTNGDNPPLHIQPLICSDLVGRPQDNISIQNPLVGITKLKPVNSEGIDQMDIPERIDIISAVTSTPNGGGDGKKISWKQQFRNTFISSAKGEFSISFAKTWFVISNLKSYKQKQMGLSGFFSPQKKFIRDLPSNIRAAHYTRPVIVIREKMFRPGDDEDWIYSEDLEEGTDSSTWPTLAVLIMLNITEETPTNDSFIFGFKINPQASEWGGSPNFSRFVFYKSTFLNEKDKFRWDRI